jgi:hypothetical protein
MILEINQGPNAGKWFTVEKVDLEKGTAHAVRSTGKLIIDKTSARNIDVCSPIERKIAIGDEILIRSSAGAHKNGDVVSVNGFDAQGNPVDNKGKSVTSRHLAHAYSRTSDAAQGSTGMETFVGIDRFSVTNAATMKKIYVAATRGKNVLKIFVENKASLAKIEGRTGNRRDSLEMYNRESLPKRLIDKLQMIEASVVSNSNSLVKHCIDMARRKTSPKQEIKVDLPSKSVFYADKTIYWDINDRGIDRGGFHL